MHRIGDREEVVLTLNDTQGCIRNLHIPHRGNILGDGGVLSSVVWFCIERHGLGVCLPALDA